MSMSGVTTEGTERKMQLHEQASKLVPYTGFALQAVSNGPNCCTAFPYPVCAAPHDLSS